MFSVRQLHVTTPILVHRIQQGLTRTPRLLWQAAVIVALFALFTVPAAAELRGTGNWIDVVSYCGSGACVPVSTNHKSGSTVEAYVTGGNTWTVYWQRHGGSVGPTNSLCSLVINGSPSWQIITNANYYETSLGTVNINTNWVSQPTICAPDRPCRNFLNEQVIQLVGPSRGVFNSLSYFGTRCAPAGGPARQTIVTF